MRNEFTNIRLPKTQNEEFKKYAVELGMSSAELAARALTAIFTMFAGDDRLPLIVAEYRLKKSYSGGGGEAVKPAKGSKRSATLPPGYGQYALASGLPKPRPQEYRAHVIALPDFQPILAENSFLMVTGPIMASGFWIFLASRQKPKWLENMGETAQILAPFGLAVIWLVVCGIALEFGNWLFR